jgi:hypothetical protein
MGLRVSQRMSELGVERVCCLLHNLVPGGSARQWVNILSRHVEAGGRATILAPEGPAAEPARAAGIDVIPTHWGEEGASGWRGVIDVAAGHDAAIVHWDHEVMGAFGPALEACGLAALVVHQAPDGLARWFGPEILEHARAPIDHALRERGAVVLVCGETHRRRFEDSFGLPADRLRVLPAAIPIPARPFTAAGGEPEEILALTRFSLEKLAVFRLAVGLTGAALAAGRSETHLRIAGEGPSRGEIAAHCERNLPRGSWEIEAAPPDPIARLATADLVVAQGLTTLEAAALGRRVVVAKFADEGRSAGIVLRPETYLEAARDPFGLPPLTTDAGRLWEGVLTVEDQDLRELRGLVEANNSLEAASRALGDALAATPRRRRWQAKIRRRLARSLR